MGEGYRSLPFSYLHTNSRDAHKHRGRCLTKSGQKVGFVVGRMTPRPAKPYEINVNGGGGEIRTHGGVSPSPVFKTGALNRSATPPEGGSLAKCEPGGLRIDKILSSRMIQRLRDGPAYALPRQPVVRKGRGNAQSFHPPTQPLSATHKA